MSGCVWIRYLLHGLSTLANMPSSNWALVARGVAVITDTSLIIQYTLERSSSPEINPDPPQSRLDCLWV